MSDFNETNLSSNDDAFREKPFYEKNEELRMKTIPLAINKSFSVSSDKSFVEILFRRRATEGELNEKSHRNCSCGIEKASQRRRARAVFTGVRVANAETFTKVRGRWEREGENKP